jgi:ParB-like chromosome segregation protein Spo0J
MEFNQYVFRNHILPLHAEPYRVRNAVTAAEQALPFGNNLDDLTDLKGLSDKEQASVLSYIDDEEEKAAVKQATEKLLTAQQLVDARRQALVSQATPLKRPPVDYSPYEVHLVADLFPLIEGDEFDKLVADIKANGLHDQIVLTHDGKQLVDGRNRFRACKKAGVEPRFESLDASVSVTAYIISKNLRRRDLDTAQRTALGLQLAPHIQEEARKRQLSGLKQGTQTPVSANLRSRHEPNESNAKHKKTAEEVGELVGVSTRSMEKGFAIQSKAPEFIEEMSKGGASLESFHKRATGKPTSSPQKPESPSRQSLLFLLFDNRRLTEQLRSLQAKCQEAIATQQGISEAKARVLLGAETIIQAYGRSQFDEHVEAASKILEEREQGNEDE